MYQTRLGRTRYKTFADLVEKDHRIIDFSDETDSDGFFIYTNSSEWCDDSGAGTFRGDTVTEAIKAYKERVQPYRNKEMQMHNPATGEMYIGNETERFIVVERENGRFAVLDTMNGRYVRYGYNNPPLYARSKRSVTVWDNYYSARCFCQKLAAQNEPLV